eukprot:86626-Prorocentrum_minimum.AAC.1
MARLREDVPLMWYLTHMWPCVNPPLPLCELATRMLCLDPGMDDTFLSKRGYFSAGPLVGRLLVQGGGRRTFQVALRRVLRISVRLVHHENIPGRPASDWSVVRIHHWLGYFSAGPLVGRVLVEGGGCRTFQVVLRRVLQISVRLVHHENIPVRPASDWSVVRIHRWSGYFSAGPLVGRVR